MTSEQNKDTTPSSQFKKKLHDVEEYLKVVLNNLGDPLFVKDDECRLLLVNDAFCNIFGLSRNEIIGRTLAENVPPSEREHFLSIDRQVLKTGNEDLCEETLTINGVQPMTILTRKNRFTDSEGNYFLVGIIHDITERKKTENALALSLQEKEILLKEIHHRVKNNLQVIVSLLNLQAGSEENEHVLDALKDSQRRIGVMAKLHETLYQSENLSTINIRDYLSDLINDLLKSLNIGGLEITNEINIDEINFDISQSIALGQIVSELISNCFKHAFVSRQSGDIKLTLHRAEGEQIMLTVTDDGEGFPKNYDIQSSKTLGLKLVKGLSQQLEGSLSIDGGSVKIKFPENKI